MPLTVDALGFATLVFIVLLFVLGLFSAFYVLRFRMKVHDLEHAIALREFDSPWPLRVLLITSAILWGCLEILRLPLLRKEGWILQSLSFQWQAIVCKVYLILSFGITEPGFFLTTAFLIFRPLYEDPFTLRKKSWTCRQISLILGCIFPLFFLQLLVIIVLPYIESTIRKEIDGYGSLPPYFTRPFHSVKVDSSDVAVCTYPLVSTFILAFFTLVYVIYFLYLGSRMMTVLINRKLQIRMRGLILIVVLFFPMHVIFLGLSTLPWPQEDIFAVVEFLAFLCFFVCVSVGEGILIIRPIADALALQCWFQSERALLRQQQSWRSIPIDHNAIPLEVFGIEENETLGIERRRLLSESVNHSQSRLNFPHL